MTSLLDRFQGALVGALAGDCIGAPFEVLGKVDITKLRSFLEEVYSGGSKTLKFTDDTQMTRGLAKSLVLNKELNLKHLAQQWTEDYYSFKGSVGLLGYGGHVKAVFRQLRESNYEDPLKFGKQQFNGSGSLGNGSAMRVSPVALFTLNKPVSACIDMAIETSLVTHTHQQSKVGAALQALSVRRCLSGEIENTESFLSYLEENIKAVDTTEEYQNALKKIRALLKEDHSVDKTVKTLGNGVSAIEAVPAAIYSFLRAFKEEDPFRKTIEVSVSLGGDTDTIASMAAAMNGAYVGLSGIHNNVVKACNGAEEMKNLAAKLYHISEG